MPRCAPVRSGAPLPPESRRSPSSADARPPPPVRGPVGDGPRLGPPNRQPGAQTASQEGERQRINTEREQKCRVLCKIEEGHRPVIMLLGAVRRPANEFE